MKRSSTNARRATGRGFLMRLLRDTRANALMIMAAALIPLIGMVGGGVDLSRMYLVKVRLQHACDAGALAGRKAMGGGSWDQNNNYPLREAQQFFTGNIGNQPYGAFNVTDAFSEDSGDVQGTASAQVPMTLMRVFGQPTATLSVTCETAMQLPNTDVMFVLDNTGSMADPAAPGDSMSKIDALKQAVKCFYQSVAREPTDANCGSLPTGGLSSQTQVRFGFVPYTSNVNVGRLLPTSFFANSWTYQSRRQIGVSWGQWTQQSATYTNRDGSCPSAPANTANDQYYYAKQSYFFFSYCALYHRTSAPLWEYAPESVNVSLLKDGSSWRDSFQWPIADNGGNKTIPWAGCIEERQTVASDSYNPIPPGAKDLNIDLVPNQSDPSTLWGPSLPDLIYYRNETSDDQVNQLNRSPTQSTANYAGVTGYSCPTAAKKLQQWPDPNAFDSYVDSLTPGGNTYHDIGMLWGARLMSPTGIFASENATTPNGGAIQRDMIFMTDGDTNAWPCDYTAYGVAWYDQRTTSDVGPASQCEAVSQSIDNQINMRLLALCSAVKNMNISLYVISFGSDISSDTENRLQTCASPGKYFRDSNSQALQTTFQQIAAQISELRLTK